MGFSGAVTTQSLLQKAIGLLARRDHSRVELARKLSRHVDRTEPTWQAQIDQVLDRLQREGKLSDERFALSFVRQKAARFGAGRLRQELQSRGLSRELAQTTVAAWADDASPETNNPSESERATAIWQRRFATPAMDARQWAQQARFLAQRGFSSAVIRAVLQRSKGAPSDDSGD